MDVATLQQQLSKNKISNVYVILGQQSILQQRALDSFNGLIPDDQRVMNVGSYDMEVTPVAAALDDAMSAPFFGERRLVIINKPFFLTGETGNKKIEHDVDGLSDYLDHPEESTVLVFSAPYEKLDNRKKVVKKLKKVGVEVSAAPLNERDARAAITRQSQGDGYQIDSSALDELVARTNSDYSLMAESLQKLELYGYQTKLISKEAVMGLVNQSLDQNVFDLVNAVLKGKYQLSLSRYRDLIESEEQPLRINSVLVSQFRLLIQVKILSSRGLSQGTLASTLKVHPYRVKLALKTVREFKLSNLEQAYLGLINIEKGLKTSQRDPQLLFELFMLQYVQSINQVKKVR
ncbi:DNA polymerase III subunit delta [Paucilactobacillus suebicus]|uniref:DNA polymerase III subunit delta n=1 Tax=Paucilactobacillus suebicus DSM 5007 = KCTC 3549 TaxID=1423807 RepID=A0A0R1W424_9LACO|nr:DNA polymerase III subunit delta [Paucilactobacillus suebicus]KRM12510.1 DNA polymerase III, delta subunit [Paucilactobacillus suebicus DSM 5007 = KCTC 3549]